VSAALKAETIQRVAAVDCQWRHETCVGNVASIEI
jgi:hypothetical protein